MFFLDALKVCDKALASAASLAQHSRSYDLPSGGALFGPGPWYWSQYSFL